MFELCKGNRLLLSTCRRSDNKLFNLCSDVKALTGEEFGNKFTNHHICYFNKKRIEINKYMMDKVVISRKKDKSLRSGLELKNYIMIKIRKPMHCFQKCLLLVLKQVQ